MPTKRKKTTFADRFSAMQKVFATAIALIVAGGSGVLFFFNTFQTKETEEEHYSEFKAFKQKYWENRKADRETRRK